MLNLKNITKQYKTGGETVDALRGVSLRFRKNEFVSILGQSGCGKTTLLNIIGGLDRYTDGDLKIRGKSTKQFKDRDWDNYRNRSVGFVFQSYNLIPHQSVLANVELALTLSGVSKAERRRRAKEVLNKVGLGDQLRKKPNQMSGGQMQRVAIARALINNPEILLADEPTGALDSETSVQIMELLKEVAKDRLVIMVTHNPDLAEQYSTRIIRLLDGVVTDDTMPYTDEEAKTQPPAEKKGKKKKPSMSFFTALSLSLNNLLTKKGRTVMTSLAGSIGIIGIALIMSVSAGVSAYITDIEESTMSSYPITVNETTMDTNALIGSFMSSAETQVADKEDGRIYSIDVMTKMIEAMSAGITTNNMTDFMKYIEGESGIRDYANDIKYTYITNLNVYHETDDGFKKCISNIFEMYEELGINTGDASAMSGAMSSASSTWVELVGDGDYIADSYELIDGNYPAKANEIILLVDKDMQISDYTLYSLGIRDIGEVKTYLEESQKALAEGKEYESKIESKNYTFDELMNHKFRVLTNADYYSYDENKNLITELSDVAVMGKLEDATELTIVGIARPRDDDMASNYAGCIGYTAELMSMLIKDTNAHPAVKAQFENKTTDLFTGLSFEEKEYTADEIRAYLANDPEMAQYMSMPDEMLIQYGSAFMQTKATYDSNLSKLGHVNKDKPSVINIYPIDFDSKDMITDKITEYNDAAKEADRITYTDTVAMLMSSVTTIVNAISYVLIAFVAISLVVSSIMIGIITYISVLERTKEIGILRAIGASKRDISRVFNAETTIVGFTAGAMGIGITLLLLIPINAIIHHATGIDNLTAVLPTEGAIALVVISVLLTVIAGLMPSRYASNRDPVVALRTE